MEQNLLKTVGMLLMMMVVGSAWGQIISQYIETESGIKPKGIEIWNNTESSLDFSSNNLIIEKGVNGGVPSADFTLTIGILAAGDVIVVGTDDMETTTLNNGAVFYSEGFTFNGNDALVVKYGGTTTDIFGTLGIDPGTAWTGNGVSTANQNISLLAGITTGDIDGWTDPSIRFETFSTHPSESGGLVGFGLPPGKAGYWKPNAASTNWATGTNWDDGNVPTSGTDVTIPTGASNYPTISAAAACNNITIEDGATLLGENYLTVNGTTTVQKSITGYTGATNGWNVISAPVSGMAMAGSDFVPVSGQDDFYAYDQAENLWRNYHDAINPATWFDDFDTKTGYLVAYAPANAGTKNFVGALNSDASYVANLSNSNTSWNLIGNPYPSNITWADVALSNTSSPKVLNNSTGGWEDIGTILATGQGIFVYAESGSASVTFELADQTHTVPAKKAETVDQVKFIADFGGKSVSLSLIVNEAATQSYEWQYDARYLYPVTTIPYLCAITEDDVWVSKYAFGSQFLESTVIPLYFKVSDEQQITFGLDHFTKEIGIRKITLEDRVTNKLMDLSNGDIYSYTASPDDQTDRFMLHVETVTSVPETNRLEGLQIYSYNNRVYLHSEQNAYADVTVYNMLGQKVHQTHVELNGLQSFELSQTTGWYVVQITTEQGVKSEKVLIK